MPSAAKVHWSQLKVGVMSLLALIILGVLVVLMTGQKGFFQPTSEIYTFLNDSVATAEGADVRLNGILIGKVSRVALSGLSEPNRIVRVTLEINNEFLASIPEDSEAGLAAQNLLGVKYVNISKGKSPQPVKAGGEIKSSESAALEQLFQQGSTTLAALQLTLTRLDGIVENIASGKGTIGKLLVDDTMARKIDSIADELLKLSKAMNATDSTLGRVLHEDALYQDFRGSMARINTLLDGLNQGQGTAGKLLKDTALHDDVRTAIAEMRQTVASLKGTLDGVNKGEGTVGKLFKSEELHDQFKTTLGRVDTLLEKINSGEGTLGQLLVNPQLYESLDGTTREMQGLLRDFRANPKKFLSIKLGLF